MSDAVGTYLLDKMLETALRDPQGVLPQPHLVPGGSDFAHTMWDWDSHFIEIGHLGARPDLAHHLVGTARDFLHVALPDGSIPNNVQRGARALSSPLAGATDESREAGYCNNVAFAKHAGASPELSPGEW